MILAAEPGRFTRLPLESPGPGVAFAAIRLGLVVAAMIAVPLLGFPYGGRLMLILSVVAFPWALLLLVASRRPGSFTLHPAVAVADFAVLAVVEIVAPETYAVIRFFGIFLIAAHSHFQGEQVGVAVSTAGIAILVGFGAITNGPVAGNLLFFYETIFALCGLATSVVVGLLRTSESVGRIRARGLARRVVEQEDEIRRRLAVVIHDGPVQELASLEMMLQGASKASLRGDADRVAELIEEAKLIARRNVVTLRDEIVALGPQAYQELSFASAVEAAAPVWRRRFGLVVRTDFERLELPSEVEGDLFRIAQEAVSNAGRHAEAETVTLRLAANGGRVVLSVTDDGAGFRQPQIAQRATAGHLGLASMRERAEALGGELRIDSGPEGTEVRVTVPLG